MKKTYLVFLTAAILLVSAGCSSSTATSSQPASSTETSVAASSAVAESESSSVSSTATESSATASTTEAEVDLLNLPVSLEDASKKFTELVPDGTVSGIEVDHSFGKTYIDVKGFNAATEYKVRIEPSTGEASIKDQEALDADETTDIYRSNNTLDVLKVLSPADAGAKALAEKPGTVTDWELDMENGSPIYKFEIKDTDKKDWDVKINALTGSVIEIEK